MQITFTKGVGWVGDSRAISSSSLSHSAHVVEMKNIFECSLHDLSKDPTRCLHGPRLPRGMSAIKQHAQKLRVVLPGTFNFSRDWCMNVATWWTTAIIFKTSLAHVAFLFNWMFEVMTEPLFVNSLAIVVSKKLPCLRKTHYTTNSRRKRVVCSRPHISTTEICDQHALCLSTKRIIITKIGLGRNTCKVKCI